MQKATYTNAMPYTFDPTHRGAPYLIGNAYKNHGEFCESIAKYHRGLDYKVNPNTRYDEDSDIPSMNASVKSSKATLAPIYGNTRAEILDTYMATVHSTLFIYIVDNGDEITEYHMDKAEFAAFADKWTTLATESGTHLTKVRFKSTSHKMVNWLEEKILDK